MFAPNQADVRRFFCGAYNKHHTNQPLEAIETLAAMWMDLHPEYAGDFADEAGALTTLAAGGDTSAGATESPFLHVSMHLSVSEQCSIDQPPGIRQAVELLAAKKGDLHAAHHAVMDCLGRMVWESQRSGRPPDGQAYIDHVRQLATAD
ncbi:MAG: DUF1841 family protein [Burkholderiales bacterium]|jgi:hypothetical protein|nr:hypothetical protein MOLA814_02332 [Betaproteobacteria bacterium MOLA814]|tara:strand:+ start:1719 stop:2165 length:447 start_codon:yes stop_codon:yes gene_type:complete